MPIISSNAECFKPHLFRVCMPIVLHSNLNIDDIGIVPLSREISGQALEEHPKPESIM